MNNNNFGNKPSFGNSPFSSNRALSSRSPHSNQRFGSAGGYPYGRAGGFGSSYGGGFGSSYGRPMSFGSSYGNARPGGFGSYSRPYSSPMGGGSFGGFGGQQNPMYRPSFMSTRQPYGSSYSNRFTPMSGSRYGYDSLPPFQSGNPNATPPADVYNKYSLENAQPQGVDVHNNFEQVPMEQNNTMPAYEQPVVDQAYAQPADQQAYDQQAYDQQAYDQPVENASVEPPVAGQDFDDAFLKAWEPSLKSLAEYSSVGSEQRSCYIIDDAGTLIGEGYEGRQEDPNNPEAEVYEYAAEINAINNAYSLGNEGQLYLSNVLSSDIPSEETATYLTQMGIKAIYFWTKGAKAHKKVTKSKEYKKINPILEQVNCKLIPVLGEK